MAKPANIQKLTHGKILSRGAFPSFVETFNWLVDFCTNLRGDGNPGGAFKREGGVVVDRTRDDHPVIRFELPNGQTAYGTNITADTTFSIVTDVRYDMSTFQLQKKTRTATVVDGVVKSIGAESGWTMIDNGQTIAHSSI